MILTRKAITELVEGRPARRTFPRREGRGEPLREHATYGVKMRPDGVEVLRATVASVTPCLLHEVTDAQARQEGFRTAWALFDAYWNRHREGPGHRAPEWPEVVYEVPVWTVALVRCRARQPRLLTPSGVPGDGHGYTHDTRVAMADEPEAVEAYYLARFAEEGSARHYREHEKELRRRESRARIERLRELEARAAKRQIDLGPHVAQLEAVLGSMEQALAKAA